jgi:hypothetical protein
MLDVGDTKNVVDVPDTPEMVLARVVSDEQVEYMPE